MPGRPRENSSLRAQNVIVLPVSNHPKPAPSRPHMPDWSVYFSDAALRKRAKSHWYWLLRELKDARVPIGRLDTWLIEDAAVCKTRVEWLEFDLTGTVNDANREKGKSAQFAPLNQYRTHLHWCMDQLGLTHASRQRIAIPEEPHDDDSDLETPR